MAKGAQPRYQLAVSQSSLLSARRVLHIEIEGLSALADALDERFEAALEILAGASGRVIVTGMGKNSHIGAKIAATMASTGTAAFFVHPAEASHGDLGMIARGDALLVLSNSGETPELADIVAYSRRFSIPLIAITGRAHSSLARSADVALTLPEATEACPMGLAPTTSTTMILALGDALAVGLLERKGFSASDFGLLHPGGRLGRMLMKVSDIMHGGEEIPLIGESACMAEVLVLITAKSFGVAGIVDDRGALVGIITDGDLRRHMGPDLLGLEASEVMTAHPCTIRPDALAAEALGLMNKRKITSLFVIDEERPIGILHIHDCLRAGIA
ncbi:MAG TPA: KpsF/GutQ family sugar-phosphate isomerase [Alphaproteobacteria bacterium]|nr:KpsF/GutQ family sugar-phosphate isomerase [Alphaproteobacteria bacterium]